LNIEVNIHILLAKSVYIHATPTLSESNRNIMLVNNSNFFFRISFLLILPLLFLQCQEDDTPEVDPTTGSAQIQFTDAPSDDGSVEGVFVTVAEVRLDGETMPGWDSKQTFDLMAYQNGNVKIFGNTDLEPGMYSNVSLVLDHQTDASGNSPGCYVLRTDGTKEPLEGNAGATSTIELNGAFEIIAQTLQEVVIDVDLRKTVRYQNESANTFAFVTQTELENGIRLVQRNRSGGVMGQATNIDSYDDKVVIAYAYREGTYNASTETTLQGDSDIRFANAVTSTKVNVDGSFNLSFLPAGSYEVILAAYEDDDQDGDFTYEGYFSVGVLGELNVSSVSVSPNAQASLLVNLFAIIP
jgi:hypothetical protein